MALSNTTVLHFRAQSEPVTPTQTPMLNEADSTNASRSRHNATVPNTHGAETAGTKQRINSAPILSRPESTVPPTSEGPSRTMAASESKTPPRSEEPSKNKEPTRSEASTKDPPFPPPKAKYSLFPKFQAPVPSLPVSTSSGSLTDPYGHIGRDCMITGIVGESLRSRGSAPFIPACDRVAVAAPAATLSVTAPPQPEKRREWLRKKASGLGRYTQKKLERSAQVLERIGERVKGVKAVASTAKALKKFRKHDYHSAPAPVTNTEQPGESTHVVQVGSTEVVVTERPVSPLSVHAAKIADIQGLPTPPSGNDAQGAEAGMLLPSLPVGADQAAETEEPLPLLVTVSQAAEVENMPLLLPPGAQEAPKVSHASAQEAEDAARILLPPATAHELMKEAVPDIFRLTPAETEQLHLTADHADADPCKIPLPEETDDELGVEAVPVEPASDGEQQGSVPLHLPEGSGDEIGAGPPAVTHGDDQGAVTSLVEVGILDCQSLEIVTPRPSMEANGNHQEPSSDPRDSAVPNCPFSTISVDDQAPPTEPVVPDLPAPQCTEAIPKKAFGDSLTAQITRFTLAPLIPSTVIKTTDSLKMRIGMVSHNLVLTHTDLSRLHKLWIPACSAIGKAARENTQPPTSMSLNAAIKISLCMADAVINCRIWSEEVRRIRDAFGDAMPDGFWWGQDRKVEDVDVGLGLKELDNQMRLMECFLTQLQAQDTALFPVEKKELLEQQNRHPEPSWIVPLTRAAEKRISCPLPDRVSLFSTQPPRPSSRTLAAPVSSLKRYMEQPPASTTASPPPQEAGLERGPRPRQRGEICRSRMPGECSVIKPATASSSIGRPSQQPAAANHTRTVSKIPHPITGKPTPTLPPPSNKSPPVNSKSSLPLRSPDTQPAAQTASRPVISHKRTNGVTIPSHSRLSGLTLCDEGDFELNRPLPLVPRKPATRETQVHAEAKVPNSSPQDAESSKQKREDKMKKGKEPWR